MAAMNITPSPSHHPNKIERTVFNASLEVLGEDCIIPIFKCADLSYLIEDSTGESRDQTFNLAELAQLHAVLEEAYGSRAGSGLALRTGRALFKHSLREFWPAVQLTDIKFRLLPLAEKLHLSADFIAQFLNAQLGEKARVRKDESHLRWDIPDCPLCRGRQTRSPSCHLFIGFLQEAYYWVSGGKSFTIVETECIAQGNAACTFILYTTSMH